MKLNFYHDSVIIYSKAKDIFYSSSLSKSVWDRYLNVFSLVKVHTRTKKNVSENINLAISSGENVSIEPIRTYTSLKSLLSFTKVYNEIKQTIDNESYFVLRLPSMIGYIAGVILIKNKKKYYVEVVGCGKDALFYKGGLLSKIISLPSYYLQKHITNNASVAIYITENYLQSKYPSKGEIYSGVSNVTLNFDNYDEKLINNRIYRFTSKNKNSIIKIGLIASLDVKYKGHKVAFKTIKLLKEKGYNIQLELVGHGTLESWQDILKKYNIEDNVIHHGMLPSGEGIYNWLQTIDIYIQPSLTEGHGRALVEAVYNGCIAFGTNTGGIPDTLDLSYTFKKNDYMKLSELIEKAINNEDYSANNIRTNFSNVKKYEQSHIESLRTTSLKKYADIVNKDEV